MLAMFKATMLRLARPVMQQSMLATARSWSSLSAAQQLSPARPLLLLHHGHRMDNNVPALSLSFLFPPVTAELPLPLECMKCASIDQPLAARRSPLAAN